jgi:hypothetical protein
MTPPSKLELVSELLLSPEQDALLRRLYRTGGIPEFSDDMRGIRTLIDAGYMGTGMKRKPHYNGETRYWLTQKGATYCQQIPVPCEGQLMEIVAAAHAAHHDPAQPCQVDCPLCQVDRAERD